MTVRIDNWWKNGRLQQQYTVYHIEKISLHNIFQNIEISFLQIEKYNNTYSREHLFKNSCAVHICKTYDFKTFYMIHKQPLYIHHTKL